MKCNVFTKINTHSVSIFRHENSDVYHLPCKASLRNVRPNKKKERYDILTFPYGKIVPTLLGYLEEAINFHQGLEHIKEFFCKKLL
jgi:hypothetical protein